MCQRVCGACVRCGTLGVWIPLAFRNQHPVDAAGSTTNIIYSTTPQKVCCVESRFSEKSQYTSSSRAGSFVVWHVNQKS